MLEFAKGLIDVLKLFRGEIMEKIPVTNLIDKFDLMRPIYSQITNYGHFGRLDLELPWEELDKVETIKNEV